MLTLPIGSLDWLKFKKLTVRKSGIQARHLYISARKRSGLRHAGKLAYPVKPLNVESLDRPIRAHKKQGNHPAGVIVDMQFPCHSTPSPRPRCGFNARNPRWFHGATNIHSMMRAMLVRVSSLCGEEEGAVETAALLRRVHYAKFWRSAGAATSFQVATARARSWVGSCRITSIIPFLIAMLATSARSWPMLRFRISASSLSCPSETAHSTQTKAPPGGGGSGAKWVFRACLNRACRLSGREEYRQTHHPNASRRVGCTQRGGPQERPTGAGPSWSCPAPRQGKAANVRCKECPDGFIKLHNGRLSIKNSIKLKKACVYSRALCLSPDRQQNKDIEAVAVGFLPPRQHVYPAQRHLLLGGVERREKAPLGGAKSFREPTQRAKRQNASAPRHPRSADTHSGPRQSLPPDAVPTQPEAGTNCHYLAAKNKCLAD